MSWSLGEVRALAVKAGKGVDMSWGTAEEAGFAAHWLQSNGLPGVQGLANLYTDYPLNGSSTCPIKQGIQILDNTPDSESAELVCQHPILLLPFLATANSDAECTIHLGEKLSIIVANNRVTQSTHGIKEEDWLISSAVVRWQYSSLNSTLSQTPSSQSHSSQSHSSRTPGSQIAASNSKNYNQPPSYSRVPDTDSPAIAVLQRFAAKTYAPATEASRLSGAGAGLNDND